MGLTLVFQLELGLDCQTKQPLDLVLGHLMTLGMGLMFQALVMVCWTTIELGAVLAACLVIEMETMWKEPKMELLLAKR